MDLSNLFGNLDNSRDSNQRGNGNYGSSRESKYGIPWWSRECEKMIRVRKAKSKPLKFRCPLEEYISYKRMVAQTTRTLKSTKKGSFRKFNETISKNTPMNLFWNKIKIYKSGFSKRISHPGNENF